MQIFKVIFNFIFNFQFNRYFTEKKLREVAGVAFTDGFRLKVDIAREKHSAENEQPIKVFALNYLIKESRSKLEEEYINKHGYNILFIGKYIKKNMQDTCKNVCFAKISDEVIIDLCKNE